MYMYAGVKIMALHAVWDTLRKYLFCNTVLQVIHTVYASYEHVR